MKALKRFRKHLIRRGQVGQSIIILALGIVVLLGFVGLTTDVALLFVRYNNLRRAVDSAAIAAAGQVRQTTADEPVSDVVARANLAARQFIEFHGLNPREVWVELCENQPREDFDPDTPGLQLEPQNVQNARVLFEEKSRELDAAVNAGNTGAIAGLQSELATLRHNYITELRNFMAARTMTVPDALQQSSDVYDAARAAWNSAATTENWSALQEATTNYLWPLQETSGLTGDDTEICTPDVRKLVRVTAQVDSPTVFLRLFPVFDVIRLEASAVSETAVLDVVVVLDVSESMLFETTYDDWASVNLGTAYVPPNLALWEGGPGHTHSDLRTVTGRLMAAGFLPSLPRGFQSDPDRHNPDPTGLAFRYIHEYVADSPFMANTALLRIPAASPHAWDTYLGGAPVTQVIDGVEYSMTYQTPGVFMATTRGGTWFEWYWQEYILGQWPIVINERLNFLDVNGAPLVTPESDPVEQFVRGSSGPGAPPSTQYPVRSFIPSTVTGTQGHPREECRVRFYPYSFVLEMTTGWPRMPDPQGGDMTIAEFYTREAGLTNNDWPHIQNWNNSGNTQPRWSMFVPTYNFYGCCNDPTSGVLVSDGSPRYEDAAGNRIPNGVFVVNVGTAEEPAYERLGTSVPSSDPTAAVNTSPDYDFSDLVCQPFKQAKDATRQFLRRIDFLRGDRVAFVTFDRSAYLVNPYRDMPVDWEPSPEDVCRNPSGQHMIDRYECAVQTLNRHIGVRTEPNFYAWGLADGESDPRWQSLAAGIDPQTGESLAWDPSFFSLDLDVNAGMDLSAMTAEERQEAIQAQTASVNYQSVYNCFIQNAFLAYPYSLYATRNVRNSPVGDIRVLDINDHESPGTDPQPRGFYTHGPPSMLDRMNPNYRSNEWRDYISDGGTEYINLTNINYNTVGNWSPLLQRSYERHGICGGGNIGAALRQASSALTDPRTSRREGSVWIIILLSDGAAGTTDGARRSGAKLAGVDPYLPIDQFDYRERMQVREDSYDPGEPPNIPPNPPNATNQYGGPPARYGSYGLCPYGELATEIGGVSRVGNLVLGNPLTYPWCSPPDPFQRHFCIQGDRSVGFDERDVVEAVSGGSLFPNSFGPGFSPNSLDRDYRFSIYDGTQAEWESMTFEQQAATRSVAPIPANYPFGETQWLIEQNLILGNIYDIDLGERDDETNLCDPLYDPFDYARDWADFIAGVDEEEGVAQLPIIFTIGFGVYSTLDRDDSRRTTPQGARDICFENITDCLGEELLRYIADAGDNFRIDNDFRQDVRHSSDQWQINIFEDYPTADGSIDDDDTVAWGPKDPCEPDLYLNGSPVWRPNDDMNPSRGEHLTVFVPGESCGNYYNAPTLSELERVFDEIATRMFTRISG